MEWIADTGLSGPVGIAGVTLLSLLSALFYLFANLLLKTGRRSDELNKIALKNKDDRIAELELENKVLKGERDHWFLMYDKERVRQ